MINTVIVWILIYIGLLLGQFFICEHYLINRLKYKRVGYAFAILFEILCIVMSCYLIVFDEFLNALGFLFLLITFFLSHKFIKRSCKGGTH